MYNQIEIETCVPLPMAKEKNSELLRTAQGEFDAERLELARVLKDVLFRSSNMERLLRFVCERYFDHQSSEIKEYSIATEGLGRPSDFDPVVDSIVRVEAHRLRIKLAKYYQGKGASHPIQIQLPPGGYVPQFIQRNSALEHGPELATSPEMEPSELAAKQDTAPLDLKQFAGSAKKQPARVWGYGGILALLLAALGTGIGAHYLVHSNSATSGQVASAKAPAGGVSNSAIRIVAGARTMLSLDISDSAKEVWNSDRYYRGGTGEEIPPRIFNYTSTSSLYYSRRRGNFSYNIPLPEGRYELRLYFADAFFGPDNFSGGGEGSRLFDVMANGKVLLKNFDVIEDIGGSNSADIKIFDNIHAGPDGFLHLDFLSHRDVAFVNAIEIVPAPSDRMRPIRLSAWVTPFSDDKGNSWISDRYFRGGVHFPRDTGSLDSSDPGNFARGRFGNFTYLIPVPDKGLFTLRLRFCRPTAQNFLDVSRGDDNFNVYLNGKTALENFSITSVSAFPGCTIKEFTHIAPTAQGKMQLAFVPNRGYAFVNTIEILQDADSFQ